MARLTHRAPLALIFVAWVAIVAPVLTLPWGFTDDHDSFRIARGLESAPAWQRPLVTNRVGNASYPGRFMPLFWLWLWASWKVLGAGAFWHRVLHVLPHLGLALWIYGAVWRAGAGPPRAALAAVAFLVCPLHYELYAELQPVEPVQTACAALFIEALLRGRGGLAAAALLTCLAFKETSLCLGLPLLVATLTAPDRRALAPAWVAYAAWLPFFAWAKPPADGSWAQNYHLTAATCAATVTGVAALSWKTTALLLPVGLAGAHRGGRRVAVAAAWLVGGLIIYLPWSQLAPRHWLWFAPPLAVVVGAGYARAGRLACALGALSLAWMGAQAAVNLTMVLARYQWSDTSMWSVVEAVASLAPPRARIVSPDGIGRVLATYVAECEGRPDVTAAATPAPGDVVVVLAHTLDEARARLPPEWTGLEPRFTLQSRTVERDLPEPRYALALARRALAGARAGDGTLGALLVPRQFERRLAYLVLTRRQ